MGGRKKINKKMENFIMKNIVAGVSLKVVKLNPVFELAWNRLS